MSLEEAIKENTAAVRELTAALNAQGNTGNAAADTGKTSNKEEKAARQAKTEQAAQDAEVETQPKITEEELHTKIRAYAKDHGKQNAKELMANYGYEKMADIKSKDFDAISKAIDEAVEADSDDI